MSHGVVDSHAHLASHRFDADCGEVIRRARDRGVRAMVVPATDLENARKVLEICEEHEDVWAAVGIHPCDAHTVAGEGWVNELRQLAGHPKVVAIGEAGLDYFHPPPVGYDRVTWPLHQQKVLRLQLDLAVEMGLNVVLHNRESWEDLTRVVACYEGRLRAQFHCFTGTLEQARPLIQQGHLISFTGIVTFKNPGTMAATAASVAAGGYLLETDAPYLAPVPHRGKRCEPGHVMDSAMIVAALRGEDVTKVAADTTETALHFFKGLKLGVTRLRGGDGG